MNMLRTLTRVVAIAVSAGWMLAPATSSAGTLSCTPTSLSVAPDSLGNLSVTCTDAGPTPPSPSTCTLTPASSVVGSGGTNLTLTASNCGTLSGWAVTSGATVTPVTATTASVSVPANLGTSPLTYTVTVANSTTPTSLSASVTVSAPSTIPPPTGTISCAGYTTQLVDIPWGTIGSGNSRVTTKGFTNGMIVVARFTTPSVIPAGISQATIGGVESNSATGPVLRTAAMSLTPCDFPNPNPIGGFWSTVTNTASPSVTYQDGGASSYYTVLKPNTTYYFNVKNEVKGAPTCPSQFSSCDMYIELSKPSGW